MRHRLEVLGWTLIWSGVLVFGYLGWQLYGTDLVNDGVQAEARQLMVTAIEGSDPSILPETVEPSEYFEEEVDAAPELELQPEPEPSHGEAFGFIRIPEIGLDAVVFEGVDTETLKSGPGHMPRTPLPGQPGNAVISGHRTTYGRPFFDFDQLSQGDRIEVETLVGTHVYEVRDTLIVEPHDVWVTDEMAGGWLTLTTCNPKFSARERLVIQAEMISGPNLEFIQLYESLTDAGSAKRA